MKKFFQSAKVAALSLGCVVAGYLLYWLYVRTGTSYRLGYPFVNIGKFAVLSPCLIAIVLALASLIWNPRKTPGLIALVVAIAGTWVLFAIGG